jgi:hypothetical protein
MHELLILISTASVSATGTWLIIGSRKRRHRHERYSLFVSSLYGHPSPESMLEGVKNRYAHGQLTLEQAGELIDLILAKERHQ